MKNFDKKILDSLGHYVYALIDPLDHSIFYVGKASKSDRAFNHLKALKSETDKTKKIREIRSRGQEPIIEVLRYGLDSIKSALEVEAAIIDTLGIENLTNKIRGHGIEKGRLTFDDVKRLHGSDPIEISTIKYKCMMFFISRTYSTSLSEMDIYDATRGFWKNVAKAKRIKGDDGKLPYPLALAIYDSVVIRVYSIIDWYEAGTTFSTRDGKLKKGRFEFVGNLIEDHNLLGKKLVYKNGKSISANRNGFGYIN